MNAQPSAVARGGKNNRPSHVLAVGDRKYSLQGETIYTDSQPVRLTRAEYAILRALILAEGKTVTHKELMLSYNPEEGGTGAGRTPSVHLSSLRKKLGPELDQLFTPVNGVGYYIASHRYIRPRLRVERPAHMLRGHSIYFPPEGGMRVDKQWVQISGLKLDLFKLLLKYRGKTLTWPDFAQAHYGPCQENWTNSKIFDVVTWKLKKKLRPLFGNDFIETVWGRGYRLATSQSTSPPLAESEPSRPDAYVIGPLGTAITAKDLPDPSTPFRWVPRRKAIVARLVEGGVVSRSHVLNTYPDLSDEELNTWIARLEQGGLRALRVSA